ncbi:MAG: aminoglycoside phosphotransferase family protein [Burkholderiales bacterium]|nr:MAG: aminoglycoside phosphotransferase family protein [Burkholderiales bacterium]
MSTSESIAAGFDRQELRASLLAMGLLAPSEPMTVRPLTGGVSSLILHVHAGARELCLKRALPRLQVAGDWYAPVERSLAELAWMRFAAGVDPRVVPRVLGADAERKAFAMQYLAPDSHPVWKEQLRDGRVDCGFAAEVGRRLARLHAASAARPELAAEFANGAQFEALRLEPYFAATAARHPDRAEALRALAQAVREDRRALMHGDISPKNILAGPQGPVFLDAECACWGDPAFDLAFCLNHLLLKGAWREQWRARFLAAYRALAHAYLAGVDWEPAAALARRAALLVAGMLLARIDGRSPVEYLTDEATRERVRRFARRLLAERIDALEAIAFDWMDEAGSRSPADGGPNDGVAGRGPQDHAAGRMR